MALGTALLSPYKPPGRLGDPNMELKTDPRTDPRLLPLLTQYGLDAHHPPIDVTPESGADALNATMTESDAGFSSLYAAVPEDLPGDAHEPEVKHSTETVKGSDGNSIILHIFRLAAAQEPLPCVYYTHGGGMTILNTDNKLHRRWCRSLAIEGCVVVMVDFRNAWTPNGRNPFPAGINDCTAGVQWVAAHKSELGISKIILEGESGGGNLALATALKAKKEGWISLIDGVYAYVPYISGGYGWSEERKLAELPSMIECDGYLLSQPSMAIMAHIYSPNDSDMTNPLAWPYFATEQDLQGLPPHVVVMDELDPLKSEGMAYHLKLVAAGVKAVGKVNLGTTHGGGAMFRQGLPDVYNAEIRAITAFAKSL